MKQSIRFLAYAVAAMVIFCMAMPSGIAEVSGVCGGHLNWALSDDGLLTISGYGNVSLHGGGDLLYDWDATDGIPWYPYRSSIREIIVEEGVTSLDVRSFWNCSNLKRITLPVSIQSCGFGVFEGCDALEDVFYAGTEEAWNQIHFPVTELLPARATLHYGTQDPLKYESYPEDEKTTYTLDAQGVLYIGGSRRMNDFTEAIGVGPNPITLPYRDSYSNRIVMDGAPWYSERNKIKKAIIDDGIVSISSHTFYDCPNLTNVQIPDSVCIISSAAFQFCTSLRDISIPDHVFYIGIAAFMGCGKLESILLPDGLEEIKDHTFYACKNLKSITIPASVNAVGYNAFYGCNSLKDVYFEGTQKQWNQIVIGPYNESLTNARIHCNSSSSR